MMELMTVVLHAALLADATPVANVIDEVQAQAPSYSASMAQARALATSGDDAKRQQAIAIYDALLLQSPGNSDVLLARGSTFSWMKRYPEAERDLLEATRAAPTYADTWQALGNMYAWSDRPAEAIAPYTRWMELRPQDPQAALARGRAHRAVGNTQAADADFAAAQARGAPVDDVARLQEGLRPAFPSIPDAVLDGDYTWGLRAGVDHSGFSGGRDAWTDTEVSLRRRFARGSLALEWLNADRFNQRDSAWALDGYASLWSRAYANLRYQQGPDDGILPQQAWRAELFQGVGQGWELSASIDHLRFDTSKEFYGVGVGRYVGNWYLRYKLQHVPGVSSGSWSHRLVVRNYYNGNADDYLEVSGSNGRSSDLDRSGALVRNSNASLGVSWTRYFRPNWGFKLGVGYSDDAAGFDERQLSLALYRRW